MRKKDETKRKALIIVGPTGVGKTNFSMFYARYRDCEIVSADSRQIYKYMDIGTAKPSLAERDMIPHHFIDIITPEQYYSAGLYGKQARKVIDDIVTRGKDPVVVGGAGFYIRALVEGMFDIEAHDESLKTELQQRSIEKGLDVLYDHLKKIDPTLATRIHPNDRQRILRAIEVYEITGTPLSTLQSLDSETCNFKPLYIGLTMNRAKLYRHIEQRVDDMLRHGLIDEVRQLQQMNYDKNLPSLQTVGYREVFQFFDGELKEYEMIDLIKKNTRNYAKRQLTWFNKNKNIKWYEIDKSHDFKYILNEIDREILLR
ncbi:tRNA (adenosine(37)-N6)-dimethylallyltransferase MiaA [candidate division KSB1 bacterium]|nr:tRNA (adenosine(37)-N6)-dimethylallyltransferase MiaA [candidate division KSB1 bacterium]